MAKDIDKETKNFLIGSAIGGAVGLGLALYFLSSGKKANSMEHIASHLGEMLNCKELKRVEKKVHTHEETIDDVLNIISAGIHLWGKIKKR